ncbi:MAG: AbrB family transcriptional regulator, partial [Pseudaminobacter sp.]|nr:AbrB family transcriptional regulator [Pseudaminobacter sp.]
MPYPANNGSSGGRAFFGRPSVRIALALLVGIAGALLAKPAGVPLPYLIGPLVACAIAAVAGAPVTAIPFGREFGQAAIGLAIGLRFVPAVLLATLKLMPAMILATIATIVATTMAAFMLRKIGGVDRKTAFFATAAAGLAEMAAVAQQKGADGDTVAVVHLVRVTAIVTTVPFLVTLFGTQGAIYSPSISLAGEALPLVLLLVI